MTLIKKFTFLSILFFIFQTSLYSNTPHFIDFKYILNQSDAGKQAQEFLKNKLNNGISNLKKREKAIQEEEKKIIKKKKVISAEEYKKEVKKLRDKVISLQKERNNLLESVSKQRAKARAELLKNVNPIIQEYMKANKIRMVIDKKSILLAEDSLDLTSQIISILNKKIKSIKLN
jgi:Skp family chaperone for outer membrane proteins